MAQPPRFMNNVYSQFPDDDSTKPVYLQAAGLTYSGHGDRHVLIWWRNDDSNSESEGALQPNEPQVTQVIQLTGQSGNYNYFAPFAEQRSADSLAANTQILLGSFTRAQRDEILGLAKAVMFERTSTVNGCRVWTRDLLEGMIGAGMLARATFEAADAQVPLVKRRPEA